MELGAKVKRCGMENEGVLKKGFGEQRKRQRMNHLMEEAEDESSGRKTEKQADKLDLKIWVRGCQKLKKERIPQRSQVRQSGQG